MHDALRLSILEDLNNSLQPQDPDDVRQLEDTTDRKGIPIHTDPDQCHVLDHQDVTELDQDHCPRARAHHQEDKAAVEEIVLVELVEDDEEVQAIVAIAVMMIGAEVGAVGEEGVGDVNVYRGLIYSEEFWGSWRRKW